MRPRTGGRGHGLVGPRPFFRHLNVQLFELRQKKKMLQQEEEMLGSEMHSKGNGPTNLEMAGERPPVENRWAEVRIQSEYYITKEQARFLHQCLISMIKQMAKGNGPRFEDYCYDSGTVTVSCKDKLSLQWLLYNVPQIEPWPGAKLTALNIQLPSIPLIVNVVLPASETCDVNEAFALFQAQNRGLNTEEWVIMSTEKVNGGLLVTISIDICSAAALKETHFRACLGFTTVLFND